MLTKLTAFLVALLAAFALSTVPAQAAHPASTDTGVVVFDGSGMLLSYESLAFTPTFTIAAGETATIDLWCGGKFLGGDPDVVSGTTSYVLVNPVTGPCTASLVAGPLHGKSTTLDTITFTP